MTAECTGTHENVLAGLIDQGVPVIVLAPHLGDAVFSCGALMTYAVSRTPVTVVTFFTEGGQGPYPRSARRYLRHMGGRDAEAVYERRRAQDRAALEPLGITCVHAGLTDAPFRRRRRQLEPVRAGATTVLIRPRLSVYSLYRVNVTSGSIVAADAGTLREVREIIHRVAGSGLNLVLAPLGVGGHVDRVLVRTAALSSGAPVAYYRDAPHGRRDPASEAFIYRHRLAETRWPEATQAKAELIRAYQGQVRARSGGGDIRPAHEVFFSAGMPSAAASSAWWR